MDEKPVKPDEADCCGSGCNPCIFDVYEEQLKKWEMKQYSNQGSAALNDIKFSPFIVEAIQIITPTIRIFEFKPVELLSKYKNEALISDAKQDEHYKFINENLNLRAGYYLILKGQYEVSGETCAGSIESISRPYTPVLSDSKKDSFKIIVALYPKGKMSQFLTRLNVNDIVFWRGPYKEYIYKTNSHQRVLLIGGGTGAIPLYNIAKEIVENEADETIMKFLASFKNVESIILREELNQLQSYWNFNLNLFITDQENKDYKLKYNEKVTFMKINKNVLCEELCQYKKDICLVLICGCESFNKFISETILQLGVIKENIFIFQYNLFILFFSVFKSCLFHIIFFNL